MASKKAGVELFAAEKQQEMNTRIQAALDELRPILDKHQVEFAAMLKMVDSAIVAFPVLKDTKYEPKPSPIEV